MDPDATLDKIRTAIAAMENAEYENDEGAYTAAAEQLAEDFNNLDLWLTRGGILPTLWKGVPG